MKDSEGSLLALASRVWRKVRVDWDASCGRSLADGYIVRLILDGTVVRTRVDKRVTNVSMLAAIDGLRDRQKMLLSIRKLAGESSAASLAFSAAWMRAG